MSEDKTADGILRDIKKQVPNVKLYKGSAPEVQVQIQSFGVREVDELCRGARCGGFTVLYGPQKAGKSTLSSRCIAQMQKDGRKVLVVDLENRLDPEWMKRQGVDLDAVQFLVGGRDFEEAMDATAALVRAGMFNGIVIDSLTAKAARGEMEDKKGKEKSMGDDTVALLARKLSEWFRRISPTIDEQKIPVIIMSQVRATNLHTGAYLDMTGGNSTKHWSSTTLQITRSSDKIVRMVKGEKVELGYWARITLKKTSICANEGKQILIPFYYGIGFDDLAAAVRAGLQDGIITLDSKNQVTFQDHTYRSEHQMVEVVRADVALAGALIAAIAKGNIPTTDSSEFPSDESTSDPSVDSSDETAASPSSPTGEEQVCDIDGCGQVTKNLRGLKIHQGRHHKPENKE